MGVATALIGAAVIGAAGSAISANQTKKALQGQQGIANRLTYQPVDIEKVKADAAKQAVDNATKSLDLERQLQPDVAAARAGLSRTINEQLGMGGKLPTDVLNQVTNAARVAGGSSGNFGGTPGVTAATIGTTALDLMRQRQNAATQLLALNPLQPAGIDPGALATLEVNQNAANNDFNAAKAGVNTNLIQSGANANAAQIGSTANSLSSLVGLLALTGGGASGSGSKVLPAANAAGDTMSPYTLTAPAYRSSTIPGWN